MSGNNGNNTHNYKCNYNDINDLGQDTINKLNELGHNIFSNVLKTSVPIINTVASNIYSENIINTDEDTNNNNKGTIITQSAKTLRNETDDFIRFICFLPGVDKSNININLDNNKLNISGKTTLRKEVIDLTSDTEKNTDDLKPNDIDFSKWDFLNEYNYNTSIQVPNYITKEHIRASYRDGVLKICFKKNNNNNKTKIEID